MIHGAQMQYSDTLVPPTDPRRLWTAIEVAAFFGVCVETVRRLHREGRLRAVPGIRRLLFTTETIDKFLRGDDD